MENAPAGLVWYGVRCARRSHSQQLAAPNARTYKPAPSWLDTSCVPGPLAGEWRLNPPPGKCVQCGSTDDLHFGHKIPWSRGGTNTVNNTQLLCGPCNGRKGADDIPL